MCCERKPDGPATESGVKERRASWTEVSEGAVAREAGEIGRSFPSGCVLCSRRRTTVSHPLGDFLGVRIWRFVEQGGAGLGELVLFPQGRGPAVSSLKVVRIVVRVCVSRLGSGSRFRFWQVSKFLPEGSSGALEPLAHQLHVAGRSLAVLFPPFTTEDKFREAPELGHQVSMCDVTPDRADTASIGRCDLSGTREGRTSFRSGELGCWRRSMNCDTDCHGTARSGPGGDETAAGQANGEGAVCQPLVGDVAL